MHLPSSRNDHLMTVRYSVVAPYGAHSARTDPVASSCRAISRALPQGTRSAVKYVNHLRLTYSTHQCEHPNRIVVDLRTGAGAGGRRQADGARRGVRRGHRAHRRGAAERGEQLAAPARRLPQAGRAAPTRIPGSSSPPSRPGCAAGQGSRDPGRRAALAGLRAGRAARAAVDALVSGRACCCTTSTGTRNPGSRRPGRARRT